MRSGHASFIIAPTVGLDQRGGPGRGYDLLVAPVDDIAAKRPYWTAESVERRVRLDFPVGAALDLALELLDKLADLPLLRGEGAHHRVVLACLRLASGDFEALERAVNIARSDWRDVLAAAEYPGEAGTLTEAPPEGTTGAELLKWLRDHTVHQAGDADARFLRDLAAYLAWVRGECPTPRPPKPS